MKIEQGYSSPIKSLKDYITDYQKIIINIKLHNGTESSLEIKDKPFDHFKNNYDYCECDIEKIVNSAEEPQTMRYFLLISNIFNLYVKKVLPEYYKDFLNEFKIPRVKSHTRYNRDGELLLISFPLSYKEIEPKFIKYDFETFRNSCSIDFVRWFKKHKLNYDVETNILLTKYSAFQSNYFYELLDRLSKDEEHKEIVRRTES